MNKAIIDSSDPGIVVEEQKVSLSDEKLKRVMATMYEHGLKDGKDFSLSNHYGIFLSIAGTLIVTLLSSEFKAIAGLSVNIITGVMWCICIVSLLIGIGLLVLRGNNTVASYSEKREMAVNEVFNKELRDKSTYSS